jgi:hypothetical protein
MLLTFRNYLSQSNLQNLFEKHMPDLDLLQIAHHACTAVSSTLPGIVFKLPGQDRNPTTKWLEHSQSHSSESITVTQAAFGS